MISKQAIIGLLAGLLIGVVGMNYVQLSSEHLSVPVLAQSEKAASAGGNQLAALLKAAEKYRFDENNLLDSIAQTLNAPEMYVSSYKKTSELGVYWGYLKHLGELRGRKQAVAEAAKGEFRLIRVDGIYAGVDCTGQVPSINILPYKHEFKGHLGQIFGRGVIGRKVIDRLIYFANRFNTSMIRQPGYPYKHVCRWVPRDLAVGSHGIMTLTTPDEDWEHRHSASGGDLPTLDRARLIKEREVQSLFAAAYFGHRAVVVEFLDKGMDVNAWDEFGNLPLHYAVWGQRLDIIKLLLERGADPMKPGQYEDSLKLRLKMRINPMQQSRMNFPFTAEGRETAPLFHAMNMGFDSAVSLMVAEGKNLGGIDLMIRKGWERYIPDMVAHGADPDLLLEVDRRDPIVQFRINEEGENPGHFKLDYRENGLALALKHKSRAQLELLLSLGASLPEPNTHDARFIAGQALIWGDMDVIRMLVDNGLQFTSDAVKFIPHLYANGHLNVVAYLEGAGIPRGLVEEQRAWSELLRRLKFDPAQRTDEYRRAHQTFVRIFEYVPDDAFWSHTSRAAFKAALETDDRNVLSRVKKCAFSIVILGVAERDHFLLAVRQSDLALMDKYCSASKGPYSDFERALWRNRDELPDLDVISGADLSAKIFTAAAAKLIAHGNAEGAGQLLENGLDPFAQLSRPVTWSRFSPHVKHGSKIGKIEINSLLEAAVMADKPDILAQLMALDKNGYLEAHEDILPKLFLLSIRGKSPSVFRSLLARLTQDGDRSQNAGVFSKALWQSMRADDTEAFQSLLDQGADFEGGAPWDRLNTYHQAKYHDFKLLYEGYHRRKNSPTPADEDFE